MRRFKVGDHIIYHKQKVSTHPTTRATDVQPCEHGEHYWYFVEKYWTVSAVHPDGSLDVTTRRGKVHHLEADDPHIRHVGLLDEWLHRDRFPALDKVQPTTKTRESD
jgi:hypothetical protein